VPVHQGDEQLPEGDEPLEDAPALPTWLAVLLVQADELEVHLDGWRLTARRS
jgi:hypothetical protein